MSCTLAFVSPHRLSLPASTYFSTCLGSSLSTTRQHVTSRTLRRSVLPPHASIKEDFFAGPSTPPRPRPLYQVILFSLSTSLLWYGYYKYCIEEELRRKTGSGLGGIGVLAPFTIGISTPLYLPHDAALCGVAAALVWIVSIQFSLYRRINRLAVEANEEAPLTPGWVVIPGFNFVVGLRSIHFLSVYFGGDAEEDPLVDLFPFLGVQTLGMRQLLTTPKLWLKL